MELINKGKTKNVYKLENGNILLEFKDDVTGKDGVFDPGENQVGLTLEGSGAAALALTTFFFEKFKEKGIPTHYVSSNPEKKTMEVLAAKTFGQGLEFICRYKAVGSFFRRYHKYCEEGQDLKGFVEVTLKDDAAGDPPITKDGLILLNLMTAEEYETLTKLTKEISDVIKDILAEKGLDLYDLKLEFGRDKEGNIMLIDEVSGGNMRIYKGNQYIEPLSLPDLLLK
ncbi:phosphoribosylaminoimidazolesuccinocarboxamide synthase [Peptoniphilus catoniae]|uniref:phosphoribosylaminoimidazolesuccinocarboxamide synthase n=1 Tax=Peptoniphilus catoniae TaxID=1660341 RepID=UPI0010FD8E1F|nr:phosphoribosylaminoimidazolesuccinocarboxamide synthase [Peptoniphilus catoniae]